MKKREIAFSPYEMVCDCWCSVLWPREMLEIQSAVLLVTAVIWSLGMCMTPGDLRAAVIPEPLTPALHDFLEGGWGENSGLQKNPNVQLEKYLHSQFRACLPGPLVGIHWVQGCPEWGAALLEHSPAVLHTGTLWFLTFPCSVSSSESDTEEKPEQGCQTLLPRASGGAQPSPVLLEWESCAVTWGWASGDICLKARAREQRELPSLHLQQDSEGV